MLAEQLRHLGHLARRHGSDDLASLKHVLGNLQAICTSTAHCTTFVSCRPRSTTGSITHIRQGQRPSCPPASPCTHAGSAASGSEAASPKDRFLGLSAMKLSGHTANSAHAPARQSALVVLSCISSHHSNTTHIPLCDSGSRTYTSSPALNDVTLLPTSSTTPATS